MTRRRPGIELLSLDSPGGGANDAWWGTARVLVKPNHHDHGWVACNELLAARLAPLLGLSVPMGEVARTHDGQLAWASALVGLQGQMLAPPDPAEIAAAMPAEAAAAVVFDVWINNIDRHEENLIYHPELGLWLLDHDQAFSGDSSDPVLALDGCKDHATRNWAFEAEQLDQGLVGLAVRRVTRLDQEALDAAGRFARARGVAVAGQADAFVRFLTYRRKHLATLVANSLGWTIEDVRISGDSEGGAGCLFPGI